MTETPEPQPQPQQPQPQPQPQQPAPPPPPHAYPPPPYAYPPPLNTYALLSLIISLVVFPPVGIWLGYVAKRQIAETGERGIELAQVGIIVGWIFTAIYGAAVLVICGVWAVVLAGSASRGW